MGPLQRFSSFSGGNIFAFGAGPVSWIFAEEKLLEINLWQFEYGGFLLIFRLISYMKTSMDFTWASLIFGVSPSPQTMENGDPHF